MKTVSVTATETFHRELTFFVNWQTEVDRFRIENTKNLSLHIPDLANFWSVVRSKELDMALYQQILIAP